MKPKENIKTVMLHIGTVKRMRSEITISFCCLILSLGILLTSATSAWIRRKWSTSIDQNNLMISSNGSLVIILEEDATTNSVSLLSYLNFSKGFTLKPVSNYSGESNGFFNLSKEESGITYQHLSAGDGETYGYIEFKFTLRGTNRTTSTGGSYTKYVYLSNCILDANENDIFGELDPSYALRVSISAPNTETIIFKKPIEGVSDVAAMAHTGVNNSKNLEGEFLIDGQNYYSNYEAKIVAENFTVGEETYPINMPSKTVSEFTDFDGGIYTDTNDGYRHVTLDHCICGFSDTTEVMLTVRIWLEGTDPHCIERIAGSSINLHLNFEAVTCDGTKIIEIVNEQE